MCDLFDDDGYSTELTSIGKDLKKILHRYAPESFIDLDVVKKVNEFIIDEYIDEGWYNYDRTYYYIYRAIKKHAYTPKFMSNYYTQGQLQKHTELIPFLDLVEWELKPALEAQRKKEVKYNKAFHGEDWVQEGEEEDEQDVKQDVLSNIKSIISSSTIQQKKSKKSKKTEPKIEYDHKTIISKLMNEQQSAKSAEEQKEYLLYLLKYMTDRTAQFLKGHKQLLIQTNNQLYAADLELQELNSGDYDPDKYTNPEMDKGRADCEKLLDDFYLINDIIPKEYAEVFNDE